MNESEEMLVWTNDLFIDDSSIDIMCLDLLSFLF